MDAPRATFFFECVGSGWTESHYLTPPCSLSHLADAAVELATYRAELLGEQAELTWIRLSLLAERTDSLVMGPYSLRNHFIAATSSDLPFACRLVTATGGNDPDRHGKTIYLAGAPKQSALKNSVPYRTFWENAFKQWVQVLVENRWGWLALQRDDSGFPAVRVAWIKNLGGVLRIKAPGSLFSAGDTVHVSYTRGINGKANGQHIVSAVIEPDTFEIPFNNRSYQWRSAGWVQRYSLAVIPYANLTVEGETSLRRGKLFRPVSWEVPEIPGFAISPCGQIVDLLRACYTAPVLWSDESALPIRRRWYFVRTDAMPAPYSYFGSSEWRNERVPQSGAGELPTDHRWDRGLNLEGFRGVCSIGEPEYWTGDATPAELSVTITDPPDCCKPAQVGEGAIAMGGATRQGVAWQRASGGIGMGGPNGPGLWVVEDACLKGLIPPGTELILQRRWVQLLKGETVSGPVCYPAASLCCEGSGSEGSGSEGSGSQCEGSTPHRCGHCCMPDILPVTISGLGNGICLSCEILNGTHDMTWAFLDDTCGCSWVGALADGGCGFPGPLNLCQNRLTGDWTLTIQLGEATFAHTWHDSEWNCNGPNCFTLTTTNLGGYCQGPVTVCVNGDAGSGGGGGGGGGGSVGTACCPGGVPTTLHGTFSGASSGCTGFPSGSIVFTYAGNFSGQDVWTTGTFSGPDGHPQTMNLICTSGGTWLLEFSGTSTCPPGNWPPHDPLCQPFLLAFLLTLSGCCSGTATLTITP